MAKTFAFECGECNSGILMVDGYKENVYSEDEWVDFLDTSADFGIAENEISVNMCSDCDLRYN